MGLWTARAAGLQAKNGTNAHTVATARGSSTPSGAFLLAVVGGGVTSGGNTAGSTPPTGWTTRLNPVAASGLYLWTKTASAGEASFSILHNASNYPVFASVFEFPAGTTWVNGVSQSAVAQAGAWSALTGIATANQILSFLNASIGAATGTGNSTVWGNETELDDLDTPYSSPSGNYFTDAYVDSPGVSSFTPTTTITTVSGALSSNTERISCGLLVPTTTPAPNFSAFL